LRCKHIRVRIWEEKAVGRIPDAFGISSSERKGLTRGFVASASSSGSWVGVIAERLRFDDGIRS
jgi:hypothetical protein